MSNATVPHGKNINRIKLFQEVRGFNLIVVAFILDLDKNEFLPLVLPPRLG